MRRSDRGLFDRGVGVVVSHGVDVGDEPIGAGLGVGFDEHGVSSIGVFGEGLDHEVDESGRGEGLIQ